MAITSKNLDLGRIISFPFKGEKAFEKILIGTLVLLAGMIIPILPVVFVEGYLYRMMKRVISRDGELEMPEWDDWGGLLKDGIKLTLTRGIYNLPFAILLLFTILVFSVPYIVPIFIATTKGETTYIWIGILIVLILLGIGIVMMFITMLVSMLTKFFLPLPMGNVVSTDSLGAAFEFRAWWKIFKKNWDEFLLIFAVSAGLAFVGSLVSQILLATFVLMILLPAVTFLMMVYVYALYAEGFRGGMDESGKGKFPKGK